MFNNIPVMPIVFALLLLAPINLSGQGLKGLAFVLWMLGGVMLCIRGLTFLMAIAGVTGSTTLMIAGVAALVIGYGKGKFVLSKTSQKNIERLNQITVPQRLIHVYSKRSWILISLMVLIAMSLNWFHVSGLLRGSINLGIGIALIVSSLAYLPSLSAASVSKETL
jgi:hypothetical protein